MLELACLLIATPCFDACVAFFLGAMKTYGAW
jgi:hypothetical protein